MAVSSSPAHVERFRVVRRPPHRGVTTEPDAEESICPAVERRPYSSEQRQRTRRSLQSPKEPQLGKAGPAALHIPLPGAQRFVDRFPPCREGTVPPIIGAARPVPEQPLPAMRSSLTAQRLRP